MSTNQTSIRTQHNLAIGDSVSVKQSVVDAGLWLHLTTSGEVLEVRDPNIYLFPVVVRWFINERFIIAGFQQEELEQQS